MLPVCNYQEGFAIGQTDRQKDSHTDRQTPEASDPYMPLCFAGDTIIYLIILFCVFILCTVAISCRTDTKANESHTVSTFSCQ